MCLLTVTDGPHKLGNGHRNYTYILCICNPLVRSPLTSWRRKEIGRLYGTDLTKEKEC